MSRFIEQSSPHVTRAVEAVRALCNAAGSSVASRAYAEAVHQSLEKEWIETNGLKEAKGFVCVQRLLGKQCGVSRQKHCDCQPPGTDHPTLWLKDGKPKFFVSQPYLFEGETLKAVNAFCDEHGLNFQITAKGAFYFPSAALCVVFTRRPS